MIVDFVCVQFKSFKVFVNIGIILLIFFVLLIFFILPISSYISYNQHNVRNCNERERENFVEDLIFFWKNFDYKTNKLWEIKWLNWDFNCYLNFLSFWYQFGENQNPNFVGNMLDISFNLNAFQFNWTVQPIEIITLLSWVNLIKLCWLEWVYYFGLDFGLKW